MRVSVTIDVPSLEQGVAFYGSAFGFAEQSRPFPTYAVLSKDDAQIALMEKPAGSSPAPGTADVRRYDRHWTPVHIDFHVEDFEETLKRAMAAGASVEEAFEGGEHAPAAFCADPFGNGFCVIGPSR